MKITIATLFPKMIESFINESIIKRARESKVVEIEIVNPRDYATDAYKTVDDRPYGGGAGMVMKVDVIARMLDDIQKDTQDRAKTKTVLTSARGIPYTQQKAIDYAKLDHLIVLAGHYEGFDERISGYVDEEISVGDYVLTGGELPSAVILDSVVRLLSGVLKKEDAAKNESFFELPIQRVKEIVGEDGALKRLEENGRTTVQLIEYPHYTRPEEYEGNRVPPILLSGDHAKIEEWRILQAYEVTKKRRPDLLK